MKGLPLHIALRQRLIVPLSCLLALLISMSSEGATAEQDALPSESILLEPECLDAMYGQVDRLYLNGFWRFKPEVNLLTQRDSSIVERPAEERKKLKDQGIESGYHLADFDDRQWEEMPVPLSWTVARQPRFKHVPFAGIGYYRTSFVVPADRKGKRVVLHFDSVQTECQVWVNGVLVGEHKNAISDSGPHWDANRRLWLDDFSFDITAQIDFGKANVLALRVADDGKPIRYNLWPDDGGIGGPVRVDFVEPIHATELLIDADPCSGIVKMRVVLNNLTGEELKLPLLVDLVPFESEFYEAPVQAQGHKVSLDAVTAPVGTSSHELRFTVSNPVAWDTETPFLYRLQLLAGGKLIGQTRVGFRRVEVLGNRFLLNGHPIYLRAVQPQAKWCWNHRLLSFNKANWLREALKLYRDWNFNVIRVNNGPYPQIFYDICDEIGLLTQDDYTPATTDLAPGESRVEMIRRIEVDEFTLNGHLTDASAASIERWLAGLHNHPSVGFLTAGNEIAYGSSEPGQEAKLAAYLNGFYDLVKAKDLQNRPVTPSSGLGVWQWKTPVQADYYDYHNYGNGNLGWADCGSENWQRFSDFARIYGYIGKPMINGECGGYRVDVRKDISALFEDNLLDKKSYVRWANGLAEKAKAPSYQDYVARYYHVAFAGVRSASDRQAMVESTATLNSLYAQVMRRDMAFLEGFALFDLDPTALGLRTPVYLTRQQTSAAARHCRKDPQFTRLRNALAPLAAFPDMLDRHWFAGDTLTTTLYLFNDQYARREPHLRVTAKILDSGGLARAETAVKFNDVAERAHLQRAIEIPLPDDLPAGDYSLQIQVWRTDEVAFSTTTPIHVAHRSAAIINTNRRIVLLDRPGRSNAPSPFADILRGYSVPFVELETLDQLTAFDLLIIAPDTLDSLNPDDGAQVRNWLEKGKRVVCLEQTYKGPIPFAPELSLQSSDNMLFADIIDQDHPLVEGLQSRHFDMWNGKRHRINGYWSAGEKAIYTNFITPIPESTVLSGAARTSSWMDNPRFGMVAGEVRIGEGVALFSQALAVRRYDSDPVATQYLRNLLVYVLSDRWNAQRAATLTGTKAVILDEQACFFVDLSGVANRSFTDEVDGDRIGGWDDQGTNDFRVITRGKAIFNGIPYKIIDDLSGKRPSCLVLQGKARPYFPEAITDIPVDHKAGRLCFLHGSAWSTPDSKAGEYRIHYADGTTERIELKVGSNIGDWWGARDLPAATVACTFTQASGTPIGLYNFVWTNPHPEKEIATIDFVSARSDPIPFCVAITGECIQNQ